ncbi:MAG: hypothetical protein K6C68_01190 [Ruminococcus sp.]|nr:hypothetical protein [Ruminococcus sp.]
MGLSSTTQHIHNPEALTKAQFKKAFCEYMKSKGYTTATEDSAELTYILVFSKDRKWVTVLSEDEADTRCSAAEVAKALKAYAVMVELVDSDFAELSLFDDTGAHIDTLTLGESYLEDAAPMGEPSAWQPLMVGSWEQVEAIQNGSYTFAEDALAEFAPIIGMDGENILLDCEADPEDIRGTMVYFKKAGARTKSLSLNAAFKQVFGEYLEPLGYRFIKGKKYPVYVRVISDEIVHIISIRKERPDYRGNPGFDIVGNPMTTYWKDSLIRIIEKNDPYLTENNFNICRQLMYRKKDVELDFDFMDKITEFHYIKNDESSLLESMRYSLDITKQWLLAEINKITDMHSFVKYTYIFSSITTNISLAFDKQTGELNSKEHDSFIIIKSKYKDDDMWNVLEECEAMSKGLKSALERNKAIYPKELMEEEYKEYDEKMKKVYEDQNKLRLKQIELRDKIFADEKLCQEISENLDRIKGESNEWLAELLSKNKK